MLYWLAKMAMTIRFHLYEHVAEAIATGLRSHGIDVTTTFAAGLAGADDPQQIGFALSQNRVIVTNDADFLRHASAGVQHAGICYSKQGKYRVGELLQILLLVHGTYTVEEMENHIEWL
jgi:hypothetical protein